MPYKLLIQFFLLIALFQKSLAGDFEGVLTISKTTLYDTLYFQFSAQQNWIRIDQKNKQQQVIQSIILNTKTESIIALSPHYKMYTHIETNYKNIDTKGELTIINTGGYKTINGFKCYLWRIRNENTNTEISYWIYSSEYDFFTKAIRLLNGTEDFSNLFHQFSQIDYTNGIPLLSVERSLLRDEKGRIVINKIDKCKLNPKIFCVPDGYTCLKN